LLEWRARRLDGLRTEREVEGPKRIPRPGRRDQWGCSRRTGGGSADGRTRRGRRARRLGGSDRSRPRPTDERDRQNQEGPPPPHYFSFLARSAAMRARSSSERKRNVTAVQLVLRTTRPSL